VRVGLAALLAVALTGLGSVLLVVTWLGDRVDRANTMLNALQDGHVAMINQETGLRGFLVTREDRFLQPYRKGARELRALDTQLWELASGDEELLEEFGLLEDAQTHWIEGWAEPVLARQPEVGDSAALSALLSADKARFDAYREVQAQAHAVVVERRREAMRSQGRVLVGGAVLGLAVTGLVAVAVRRANRRLAAELLPPTQRLRDGLAELTEGRLDSRVEESGPVEFRAIAGDVNTLATALRDRDEQVAVRERELVAARDQAERAGQAKTAFLATMSHEIRTPLNAVLGLTDVLLTTRLDDEQRGHLDTIAGSGDSLLTLINDVLDFSKIEAGELDLERAPFDLHDVVYDVAHLLAQQAAAKGLDLLVDVPGDRSWAVVGDGARLRQVLTNLVGNAVKFTPSGQVVVAVSAVPLAGRLACRIAVSDTGIGIPAEHHHRLFKSFSQVDASTTRSYGGTGLGLAISQRIAHAMQGEITVDSEPGVGSTFAITVVLEEAAQAEDPAAAVTLAGRRLLVVDDNETNLRILEHQLSASGATPVLATGGAQALEIAARDGGFDACLLDLHMPGMDGDELAARLRALPGLAAVPLILLSSSTALEPARCAAFAARLHKPVRPERLLQAVHAVLSRPGSRAPAVLPAGPSSSRRGLRVLVAEDHAVNAQLIGHYLRQLGHQGTFVTDGEQAVRAVVEGDVDVVLMDAQMPVLGGVDATAAIRLLPGAQPRIIALTASVLASDRTAFADAGADDFLTKPVRLAVLAAALDAWAPAPAPVAVPAVPEEDGDALDAELVEELRDLGDEAFSHLYGTYVDSLLSTVEALLAAAEGDAWSEDDEHSVPRLAHRLKGSSAAMGASRVADICQRLQVLHAAPPADELRSTLGELEAESRRVSAAVATLLDA
jgi:signal transduction histidine kinase/DNA-binding response OmpR family regulator/HPt (histidine-containing phosphotransfer) domain-containing protein